MQAAASLPHRAKPPLQHFHPAQRELETRWLCGNDCIPGANALRSIDSQASTQVSEWTRRYHHLFPYLWLSQMPSPRPRRKTEQSKFRYLLARCFHFFSFFMLPWQPNATGKASLRLSVWRDKVLAIQLQRATHQPHSPGLSRWATGQTPLSSELCTPILILCF